ncbi:condensation domain-containing protein [Streptomyces sp. NPDC127112]|uniref:condensation domain-containing protein n=1 Tax=Streptomyces sp. NPDC127112 TaxID=3345364 RepID=UPI0036308140
MAEPVHRTGHPAGPDPVRTLRTLFAEVLGRAEVDAGDSFTGLGGDSIQAIQVVSRARAAGLVVSTRDVLRADSVGALAATARAQGRVGEEAGPATPPRRLGPLAPTPIMGWLAELGGPVDTYNQSLVLRTPPGFGAAAAERTVQALLDTHEMLRLRLPDGIGATGAEPVVPPAGSVAAADLLEHVDARGTAEEELPALTRERMRAARRLLSPRDGHMLRAVLLDRGPGRQGRLALVIHHLVVDGVSWRILQDDLRSCWTALTEGREPVLEPAATPFAHWADLLRAEATSGRRTAEADRWAAALREAPQPLAGVRPPGGLDPESPENTLTLTLGPDVTGPLLTTAPGHDFALDDADQGLPMAHAVEVNAAAHEGPDGLTLSATWTWAGNALPGPWVHDLAREWFTMLRAVVTHAARPDAGGLTPSDVSLAQVSQADLDTFESQLGALL